MAFDLHFYVHLCYFLSNDDAHHLLRIHLILPLIRCTDYLTLVKLLVFSSNLECELDFGFIWPLQHILYDVVF